MDSLKLFEQCSAILTNNHFVYTSGKHGANYVNKDAVYPHTAIISALCQQIAEQCPQNIDVVAGPTVGAVIISQWVAHYLSQKQGRDILAVFAEENPDKTRVFRRGYDKLIAGKQVLIVEDILTTGGSVKAVVAAVKNLGGTVAGIFALCNRGQVISAMVGDVPLQSLVQLQFEMWDAAACPLCAKGVPVNTQIGKGKEFVKNQ